MADLQQYFIIKISFFKLNGFVNKPYRDIDNCTVEMWSKSLQ